MSPQDFSGGQTTDDHGGDALNADVVITAATATATGGGGGEKNSTWFRYVVISIGIFISHRDNDDDEDEENGDHHVIIDVAEGRDDQITVSDGDRLVRIVKDRDLKALRRLGGVDRAVSLQRSHFEENLDGSSIFIDGSVNKDPQEHWKSSAHQGRGFTYFLIQSFNNYTIVLLFISAALLFAIGTVEQGPRHGWHEGVAVIFAISLLVSFSSVGNFWREKKAAKKLLMEKKNRVIVERNGTFLSVFVPEVKMWDTVHLEEGDQVPANGLIVSTESLRLNEVNDPKIDRDQNPFLVSGSKVEEGRCSMIVIENVEASFDDCYHGLGHDEETFLQSLMQKPYEYIEKLGLSMSVLIASIALIRLLCVQKHNGYFNELPEIKGSLTMKILVGIFEKVVLKPQGRVSTLASALVMLVVGFQHGTPFVIGCCLSHWNKRLSNNHLSLQNLSASCTLGLVTVFVVDVTHGDLLHKKAEVKELWIGEKDIITENKSESHEARPLSVLNSILQRGLGVWDYMPKISVSPDSKFLVSWEKSKWGTSNSEQKSQVVEYRRTSSSGKEGCEVLMRRISDDDEERSLHLHWKGPPSAILEMCSHFYDFRGERHAIANKQRKEFQKLIKGMETNGHMAIAFAYGQTEVRELKREGLNLLAIVRLRYTCGKDVKMLVKALRDVGLSIKLASEDELPLVKSIAWDLGFSTSDTILEARTIRELGESPNNEEMKKLLDQITVMGNSLPDDKFRMVEKLQENGHIVAFGGGLSRRDTSTLKRADLVIAQESRSIEIAKNASDILLKTPHPCSLTQLRHCGKCEYQNIQKFFMIQLTFWISGLTVTLVSTILSGESPLTSAQMIWVNIMTCLLCGLMMVLELNKDDRPAKRTQLLVTQEMWTKIAIRVFYQVLLLLAIHFLTGIKYASTKPERDVFETMIFNTFALCQNINLLSSMNLWKKEVLEVILKDHYWFLASLALVLSLQVVVVQFGHGILSSEKLSVRAWASCFLMAVFSALVDSAVKQLISWFPISKFHALTSTRAS